MEIINIMSCAFIIALIRLLINNGFFHVAICLSSRMNTIMIEIDISNNCRLDFFQRLRLNDFIWLIASKETWQDIGLTQNIVFIQHVPVASNFDLKWYS